MSVLTGATKRQIPEDGVLHSRSRGNLKSYKEVKYNYSESSIYRSRIHRSITTVLEQILFYAGSRIYRYFTRPTPKTVKRDFAVYGSECTSPYLSKLEKAHNTVQGFIAL
jgi:hypothetical protein